MFEKKQYYFLREAAQRILSETGLTCTNEDLITKAREGELFLHASASNWLVKLPGKEPFQFTGLCALERTFLIAAIQTIEKGEQFYLTDFSTTRDELIRHAIQYDDDFPSLMRASEKSCPLTLTDLVVKQDSLVDFIERCPSKENNITKTDSTDHPSIQEQSTETELCNRFILAGEYWQITFNQKTVMVKNTKGIQYIDYLIRNKRKEIHVSELCNAIDPQETVQTNNSLSKMTLEQLNDEGFSVSNLGTGFDLLDKNAIASLKLYIEQLDDQIEEANEFDNIEKKEKLESEKERIVARLSADMGLAGKSRLSTSPIEKIRKNVEKRVSTDINKLQKSFPDFADHLKTAIKTGTTCKYTPVPDLIWGLLK